MTNLIDRWARERPFLLAFALMLAVVLPGFVVTGVAIDAARDSARSSDRAAATAQAQVDQNTALIECLTTYVDDPEKGLTDALQDRDVVTKTARAAAKEWLATFERLVRAPETPNARETFLAAIDRYQRILGRLDRTSAINPYPDISACLSETTMQVAFRLVSSLRHATCADLQATYTGTRQADVIHGTDSNDVIKALGGDDIVLGGKGDDYICGGRGDDTLNGGQDHDRVRGNRGDDYCIQAEKEWSC